MANPRQNHCVNKHVCSAICLTQFSIEFQSIDNYIVCVMFVQSIYYRIRFPINYFELYLPIKFYIGHHYQLAELISNYVIILIFSIMCY